MNLDKERIFKARQSLVGRSLSLSYRDPLLIVRGEGQFLYDENGRAFLDCVNNVCHVGHAHPRVVEAASRQMAQLNTNTRYLHPHVIDYATQLTSRLPAPLEVCFFVNSGSEANDLALRLARTYTGQRDVFVIDHAYHGHTGDLIEISPYKYNGAGGTGRSPYTHQMSLPDGYRGRHRWGEPEIGVRYAAEIHDELKELAAAGRRPACFIAESIVGCGGQVVLPPRYLATAFESIRKAGGVCIVDEVQVGFGRVGSHFWAFETQEVVPDIVTMGKPIGNGHPLAAVVTTREIADAFANGMEYFNTFGGNPVSCAVGLAVLEVLESEDLQKQALQVGEGFKRELERLKQRHRIIGDVRGMGLFLGIEFVRDRETLEPAGPETEQVVEFMKERGILLSTDGPYHNVIKIKPPLVFNHDDAAIVVEGLDEVLSRL